MVIFIYRNSLGLLTLIYVEKVGHIYQSLVTSRDMVGGHCIVICDDWNGCSSPRQNNHHRRNYDLCIFHVIDCDVAPSHDHRDADVVHDNYRDDRVANRRRCGILVDFRRYAGPLPVKTSFHFCSCPSCSQVEHHHESKIEGNLRLVFVLDDNLSHLSVHPTYDVKMHVDLSGISLGSLVCWSRGWIQRHREVDHSDWPASVLCN